MIERDWILIERVPRRFNRAPWPPKPIQPRTRLPSGGFAHRTHVERWLLVAQAKALRALGGTQQQIADVLELSNAGVAGRYFRMPVAGLR